MHNKTVSSNRWTASIGLDTIGLHWKPHWVYGLACLVQMLGNANWSFLSWSRPSHRCKVLWIDLIYPKPCHVDLNWLVWLSLKQDLYQKKDKSQKLTDCNVWIVKPISSSSHWICILSSRLTFDSIRLTKSNPTIKQLPNFVKSDDSIKLNKNANLAVSFDWDFKKCNICATLDVLEQMLHRIWK